MNIVIILIHSRQVPRERLVLGEMTRNIGHRRFVLAFVLREEVVVHVTLLRRRVQRRLHDIRLQVVRRAQRPQHKHVWNAVAGLRRRLDVDGDRGAVAVRPVDGLRDLRRGALDRAGLGDVPVDDAGARGAVGPRVFLLEVEHAREASEAVRDDGRGAVCRRDRGDRGVGARHAVHVGDGALQRLAEVVGVERRVGRAVHPGEGRGAVRVADRRRRDARVVEERLDAHDQHAVAARAAAPRRGRAVAAEAVARAVGRHVGGVAAPAAAAALAVDNRLARDVARAARARTAVRAAAAFRHSHRRAAAAAADAHGRVHRGRAVGRRHVGVRGRAAAPALAVDRAAAGREHAVPRAAAAAAAAFAVAVDLHGAAAAAAASLHDGVAVGIGQNRVAAVRADPALHGRLHARAAAPHRHRVGAGREHGGAVAHAAAAAAARRAAADVVLRRHRAARAAAADREHARLGVLRQREAARRVREHKHRAAVRKRRRRLRALIGHARTRDLDLARAHRERRQQKKSCQDLFHVAFLSLH